MFSYLSVFSEVLHREQISSSKDNFSRCRQEFKHQNIPTKLTKLTAEVNNYRPRAHAVHNVTGGNKAQPKTREEPEVVKEKIFKAFELHQYYSIQDLQRKTGQPVVSVNSKKD